MPDFIFKIVDTVCMTKSSVFVIDVIDRLLND